MAKGKNAAALFEVIHSSKKPGLLRTPRWWFKGRPAGVNTPTASGESPESAPQSHEQYTSYEAPPSELPRAHLNLDRGRRQFTMRMNTSTALVGGFAVVVALGLAYVIGQHVAGGPKTASASDATTEQIRQQPAAPATLDVPRHVKQTTIQKSASGTSVVAKRNETANPRTESGAAPATGNVYNPEPHSIPIGPRLIGKNYVLVQSYPPNKASEAQKLCDVLSNAGVPCSIEKVPGGYFNPDGQWVAVISRQGFTGKSDRDCKACLEAINEASRKAKIRTDVALFQWK